MKSLIFVIALLCFLVCLVVPAEATHGHNNNAQQIVIRNGGSNRQQIVVNNGVRRGSSANIQINRSRFSRSQSIRINN